jgi:3,4-dihydroxy 2-butanone 4-phosphate synthase/GTP cyclohydrolase II
MVKQEDNTASHQTPFTVSVDYALGTTTGISASDRAKTVVALADPDVSENHFVRPGHIFPLSASPGGVFRRMGHTEAAVDLMRLAALHPTAVLVEIMNQDGTMARVPDLMKVARKFDLKIITIKDLLAYRLQHESRVERVVTVHLPTRWGEFELIAFRDSVTGDAHLALCKGTWDPEEPVIVRLHSECVTGDAFGSLRCDCGDQIEAALQMIERAGKGILIYLKQEGRGIGLLNKLKAYRLQEAGFDTVQANVALGFESDSRDYTVACHILCALQLRRARLLTNNPGKLACLQRFGIEVVEQISMPMQVHGKNRAYLRTKHTKMGHSSDLLLNDSVVSNWD